MSVRRAKPVRNKRKAKRSRPQPKGLRDEDMQALQNFCADYAPDEMSFDAWCACEEQLDLSLFLTLTVDEARAGGSRQLKYSRTITQRVGPRETKRTRESTQCVVSFPPGVQTGAVLVIDGAGDQCGNRVGELRITVRVK